eukprot:749837-Amphidinium_carterae.1
MLWLYPHLLSIAIGSLLSIGSSAQAPRPLESHIATLCFVVLSPKRGIQHALTRRRPAAKKAALKKRPAQRQPRPRVSRDSAGVCVPYTPTEEAAAAVTLLKKLLQYLIDNRSYPTWWLAPTASVPWGIWWLDLFSSVQSQRLPDA